MQKLYKLHNHRPYLFGPILLSTINVFEAGLKLALRKLGLGVPLRNAVWANKAPSLQLYK